MLRLCRNGKQVLDYHFSLFLMIVVFGAHLLTKKLLARLAAGSSFASYGYPAGE